MRTGKNGLRRITAMVCALALCASMLPTAVFATEPADVADAPVAAVTQPVEDEQQEVVETPVQDETDSTPAPETDETKAETTTPAEPAEGVNESAAQPVEGEDPAELVEDEEETEPAEEPSSSVEPVEEVPAEEVQLFNAPVPRSGANIYEDTNLGISINVEQNTGLSPTEVTFIVVVEGQQVQKITRGDIRLIGETLTIEADGYDVECRTLGGMVTATYIEGQDYWNLVPGAIDGRVLCISIAKPKTSDDVTVADVQNYGTFSWTKGEAGTAAFPRRLTVYVNEEYAYQTMVATPRNLSNAGSNDQFWFTPNTDLYNADVRLDRGLTLDTGAMADLDIYLTTKCSCGNSYCDCPGGKDCTCTQGCTCEQCNPPQGETEIRTPYGTLEYNKSTGSGYNLTVEVYVNGQLEETLDDNGNPLRVQVGLTGCLDFTPANEYYYFNGENSYDIDTLYAGSSWEQRTGYLMIIGMSEESRNYDNVLKIYLWTFKNHTKLDVERRPSGWGGDANIQENMTGYMISYEAYNPVTKQNETYTYEATSFLLAQSQMIPIGTPVTITAICNSPYEVSQWSSADAYTALNLVGSEGNESETTAKGNSATLTVNSTAYVSVTVYADSLRTVTPPTEEDLVDNKDEIFGAENSAVIVDCVNADVNHANKTSGLKEDTFSISNLQGDSASGYYVTVTITKPDTYVEEYNKDFTDVTHERNDSETKIIRLNWEVVQQADGGKKSQWKAAEPATIEVICKEDTTIPDPTPEDLNKLGKIINIACTNNSSHDPITSALRGGNGKDYIIAHEANSNKATVTILNTDPYVKSYKQGDGQGKDHTLDAGSDLELGLVYVNGAWTLDDRNSATVYVTCAPIVITPADLVIYKGGEQETGSSNVNIVNGAGETMTNNGSLPEMGFYLQLSDELNQQLSGQSDAETQDLSRYITLKAKDQDDNALSWKLEKYGDGTSVASGDNGYFIYKIVPTESGTCAKLNVTFQDSEGVYVDTDAFTLTNSLSEEYSMRIYGDRVDAGTLKAEITISGQPTFTVGVVGAEDPATLTVRYVNGDQIDVVTHSYDSIEAASEADDPKQKALHTAYMIREDSNKFVINESNVQVDGEDVSLLFDDIVDSTSYEYEKTLTSKAVAAAITADGSLNGVTLKTEAKYLDLVESGNGNAWVTAQDVNGDPQAVKVYWPYPEGTNKYTKFYLAHFEDLDRDTSTAAMAKKLSSAKATGMSIQKDDYGISFTTTDFSPYVLVWEESQGQVTPPDNGDGNNNTTTNNNTQNTTVNVAANNSAAAPAAAAVAIPQTGDNSQPLVWIALVGISGAALAALAVFRRKRSDK